MLEMPPKAGRGASTLAFPFLLTSSLLPVTSCWPNFPRSQLARKPVKHRLRGASLSLPSTFHTEQSKEGNESANRQGVDTILKLLSAA